MRLRRMRPLLAASVGALLVVGGASASVGASAEVSAGGSGRASAVAVTSSATPPAEFGSDWDDPRTPEPPVAVPSTRHCTVRVVDAAFADFDVHSRDYTPPPGCAGPWSKVVMRLDGSVAGRQFDRIGHVDVGGVRMLTLSTPEPSVDGIRWHVEKDVTDLAPLLADPQQVQAYIGNVVDATYTGVIHVTVDLDFYTTGRGAPAAQTSDAVLPLAGTSRDGTDLVGSLTVPRNSTRLLADVFATGSGGGCEEFWDTSAPASTGYSCPDGLPYREVDVRIDGQLAGIAAPYPVVYTGGWSNPFLWYAIPSPKAFDIPPLGYDLTPFLARLDDGRPHDVRLSVVGLPPGQDGWTLAPRFRVWRDAGRGVVSGTTDTAYAPEPVVTSTVTGAGDRAGHVDLRATRELRVSGTLSTSRGPVTTTVTRTLGNTSTHSWTDDEADDTLRASWTDTQSVATSHGNGTPTVERTTHRWDKDGVLGFHPRADIAGGYDVTGDLAISWERASSTTRGGARLSSRTETSSFDGRAAWIYGVPRDQRHATADTSARSTLTERSPGRVVSWEHRLRAVNGTFVTDMAR
ncbi:peptide-N4-asparagine amidase [Terrabacter carboxydivorans]|uniref:Peptide N-acetyl-beta-D-glucosaminyl asparaginase amidase A N-terminal domain-containing protein n=1 Tax=Terrabacter carboxydivorans TaxID=619730 RepID=A0ABN3L6J8_9MICO